MSTHDLTQHPEFRQFLRDLELELLDEVPGEQEASIDNLAHLLGRFRAFLEEREFPSHVQQVLYARAVENLFVARRWTAAECREMKEKFSAVLGIDVQLPA